MDRDTEITGFPRLKTFFFFTMRPKETIILSIYETIVKLTATENRTHEKKNAAYDGRDFVSHGGGRL
jgi:hypothetical protein